VGPGLDVRPGDLASTCSPREALSGVGGQVELLHLPHMFLLLPLHVCLEHMGQTVLYSVGIRGGVEDIWDIWTTVISG
jgi:hypothetical protein